MGLWRTENGMDGNVYGRCSVWFLSEESWLALPLPFGFFVFVSTRTCHLLWRVV